MDDSQIVYRDQWGEIIDRPSSGVVELRWFDSTAAMGKDDFQRWLSTFAEWVGRVHRSWVLIDGTGFKMNPALMDGEWRDANIIPRYNAAGVVKFAFHMLAGMPIIGQEPAPEGPATFPTGYFATRRQALEWLSGQ